MLSETRVDNDFLSVVFQDDVAGAASAGGTSAQSLADIGISTNATEHSPSTRRSSRRPLPPMRRESERC